MARLFGKGLSAHLGHTRASRSSAELKPVADPFPEKKAYMLKKKEMGFKLEKVHGSKSY
jgi:hypothetical protein